MARSHKQDELVLLPLGGVGEIGMNLYLYGYGPPRRRQWLMVDLGITFPGEREPGIDVIVPDIRFIEEERGALAGIILTHAHEDHLGAVMHLWPRLRAPLYATPFAAALLRAKLAEEGREGDIPIEEIACRSRLDIGPFDVELVDMAHSIPESNALAIRTPAGTVLHSGDWKLDPDPITGSPTDEKRLREIGGEGVDALVCDSTNALRDGVSPSERDVAETLARMIAEAPNRVAVTTFASNIARLRSVIQAAEAAGRQTVVVGRAMIRALQIARETGHLPADTPLLSDEDFRALPRDKVVALCTGSQGETRGALARIATGSHPKVAFAPADLVIYSSRTIPGNEKAVGRIQNALVDQGAEVVTDADALVHCSGHPRRGELAQLYDWIRPKAAVPMHGEARHLAAHATLARSLGVGHVVGARNGSLVRLCPAPAEQIDEAPAGRLHKDGRLLVEAEGEALRARRRLSVAGMVTVSLVLSAKGGVMAEPRVALSGVPDRDADGRPMADIVLDAVHSALDGIPKPRLKSSDLVGEAVRRAVRAGVNEVWGKRPHCAVLVSVL